METDHNMNWEEYKVKCYRLSRRQEQLRAEGAFDKEATGIIEEGLQMFGQEGISFLESMIVRGEEYNKMDEAFCPILIYVGNPICYGVLDLFAYELGKALEAEGETVEYFNPYGDRIAELVTLMGKRFRAIIGIQTFAFSVKLKTGENVHDSIIGPKFNMFLDHPIWMREHITGGPKDYTILTHDQNYVDFIRKYYSEYVKVDLLPPAGQICERDNVKMRSYDFSFIGTYHNWRLWISQVKEVNRRTGGIARRMISYILKHRNMTWEAGLKGTLEEIVEAGCMGEIRYRMAVETLSDERCFADLLFDIKPACFMVMSYLREKVLDTIVGSGIMVHLFSVSFRGTKYEKATNVMLHEELYGEEALNLYADSKVSLNIMSWHKAGMTERIANMFLNGAVMITDTSTYLEKEYVEGEDYFAFSLDEMEKLPSIIRSILDDPDRQQRIRNSAYRKAARKETWEQRAKMFLEILYNH